MVDIMPYLMCLNQSFSKSTFDQLALISQAMFCCQSRVTMRGLSRWSEHPTNSYRRIQRFYSQSLDWLNLHWLLIKSHRLCGDEVYLLTGDETTVSKAGKQTWGLGKFFSSVHSRRIKGLGFFSLSLVGFSSKKTCPLLMEQLPADMQRKVRKTKAKSTGKRGKGRPKGSKNKNRQQVELTDYLQWIQSHIQTALQKITETVSIVYFVYDGAFGNNESLQMVKACGVSLISKLQCRADLWFPYEGPYSGKGSPKKYAQKLCYQNLPQKYLKRKTVDKEYEERIFQMSVWHKKFADLLNVTIIQKTRIKDQKMSQVILFSDDLQLSWENMISYYRLRFQIEFTFRDAKQFWGLEDFMNIREQNVKNAANLSMFMVNLSRCLIETQFKESPIGVFDLKARAKTQFFMERFFKINPKIAGVISFDEMKNEFSHIGCILQMPVAA